MPIHQNNQIWILETEHSAYGFGFNRSGRLVHTYWGNRLPAQHDYPSPSDSDGWASFDGPSEVLAEEYPCSGGMNYHEPCLKISFADGVRDVRLKFQSSSYPAPEHLILHLHDPFYPLVVDLHYRIHPDHDLIERWAELQNQGELPIQIERALSAAWQLPASSVRRISHLGGRWNDEFNLYRQPLTPGVFQLESRRLSSGHQHNPWFALENGLADEQDGEVWFGVLAWSGSWKLCAETTPFERFRLLIGINDWDFAWQLDPGEIFSTPHALAGYTQNGFGAASRLLHTYLRSQLPHAPTLHKVLYNSWEATLFDVSANGQTHLAQIAAQLGVERFVMDDGWFCGRHHDSAGLGDWTPDPDKFPHGLYPLIRSVQDLGMDFGLWIEPEMVNPDSNLYRTHPDWVFHYPTRPNTLARNQLMLNLARPDVQEYLIQSLSTLLAENEIAFIKWDMNRNVSEAGWPGAPRQAREVWVRYTQGVYHVWNTLRQRFPHIIWQSCSGGGGRSDAGILQLADQIWPSDNTSALARLRIQEGFLQAYPANVMESWVTDADRNNLSLNFRFHVSMCGSLGIGGNLLNWSLTERLTAARCIARYKALRPIIQGGDLYRLRSFAQDGNPALLYLDQERENGALFAFCTRSPNPAAAHPLHIRLQGLPTQTLYMVEGQPLARSGASWMQEGFTLPLQPGQSLLLQIARV